MEFQKINVGIDLVNFKRKEFKDARFAKRICTPDEYALYLQKPNAYSKKTYLASLWAIKEAILKATHKSYGLHEINVLKTENGSQVKLAFHEVKISVSYEDKYVTAMVIAYCK